MLCARAGGADFVPRAPELDFIPTQWLRVSVRWGDDWEKTLGQNLPGIGAGTGSDTVAGLREIELYKAMIERFADRKEEHGKAYLAIAGVCDRIGLPEMGAYYAWKTTREFPDRPELVARAYLHLAARSAAVGSGAGEDWTFALYEALDLAERGRIPAGHQAVWLACEGIRQQVCREMRYDQFAPALARFRRLAGADRRIGKTIASLLREFGETESGETLEPWKQDAGAWWVEGKAIRSMGSGQLAQGPFNSELESRLEVFLGMSRHGGTARSVQTAQVQKILDLSVAAGTEAYLKRGDRYYVSYGRIVEQALETLPRASLPSLREEQEKAARPDVRAIRVGEDTRELARLSRRYPYAAAVHEALVELGEWALRQGHFAQAAGAFGEVIGRSDDPALCAQARIGMGMAAAAGAGGCQDVETILAGIPDDLEVAWRGVAVQAGRVKAELKAEAARLARPPRRTLADLPRATLTLPPGWPLAERHAEGPVGDGGLHASWPAIRIEESGQGYIVTGPGRVACFEAGTLRQRWTVVRPGGGEGAGALGSGPAGSQYMQYPSRAVNRRPAGVPGAGSHAVADEANAVYLLSGGEGAVTATDTRTGKTIWSTAGRAEWRKLAAMNHPTASHGRVYVLAVPVDEGPREAARIAASGGPWNLVCLDGRDGAVVWKTPISWQGEGAVDLARGGSPVTILGDAVYCCPGMGVLARCDARDGRLDWVLGYPSAVGNVSMADALVYAREGSSPLVAGQRLLVAPRDGSGVMAFSPETGEFLWNAPMVPSDRVLGVSGRALVTAGGEWVAALDVASGKGLWFRRFPEGVAAQAVLAGENVAVLANRTLHLLAADTGRTVEQKTLAPAPNAEYAFGPDGTLCEMILPRLSERLPPPTPIKAPLAGPLVRAAYLPCEGPSLVADRARSGDANRFCILSGRRVLRVTTEPELKVAWECTLSQRPDTANVVGARILFSTDRQLTAVALAAGTQEWTLPLPFVPYSVGGDDKLVLALPGTHGAGRLAAIDPAAGKLLWTRSLAARARFRGGVSRVELLRRQPAPASLRVVLPTLFDAGWQAGRVDMEAATGRIAAIQPFAPSPEDHVWFSGEKLMYAGADPAVRIAPRGAGVNVPAYGLPRPDAPGIHEVLAHRIAGDRVLVVSGATGQQPHAPGRSRPSYRLEHSRVYVDVFETGSRKHLARQTLDGIRYATGGLSGYDTHAEVLDRAVVVTDATGVHVFAGQQSPAGKP